MKSNYKKLGSYIREINIRNQDLEDLPLLGVSVNKNFIPSIANTVGTDFSKYKKVSKNQFTYIPDTSRRGDKIGIAILLDYEKALVSQAYTVFEVVDTDLLSPEYLMLWFKRPEFDRYARFKSEGSVREIFSWNEMCNVELPIPDIEKQRKIVAQYNQINKAIQIKEAINNNLEQQIGNLFNKVFQEDENYIDLDKAIQTTSGGTPSRDKAEYYQNGTIDWIKSKELSNGFVLDSEEKITKEALSSSSAKILEPYTVLVAMYGANVGEFGITTKEATCNQAICALKQNSKYPYTYLYGFLKVSKAQIKKMAVGSAQQNISQQLIKQFLIHSNIEKIKEYHNKTVDLFKCIEINQNKISLYLKLRDILLPKLMSGESSAKLSFSK